MNTNNLENSPSGKASVPEPSSGSARVAERVIDGEFHYLTIETEPGSINKETNRVFRKSDDSLAWEMVDFNCGAGVVLMRALDEEARHFINQGRTEALGEVESALREVGMAAAVFAPANTLLGKGGEVQIPADGEPEVLGGHWHKPSSPTGHVDALLKTAKWLAEKSDFAAAEKFAGAKFPTTRGSDNA